MMRELNIEWRHLDLEGKSCLRCSETGKTLEQLIKDLRKELEAKDIDVTFSETSLPKLQIQQSNIILFNGVPLEDILPETEVSTSYCCSCMAGRDTYCRTIVHNGTTYEEIPGSLIRAAALRALLQGEGV